MAVRIRMKKCGKRNAPFYRIGIFDSRSKRDGKSIEIVGTYHPGIEEEDKKVTIDEDRVKYWLSVGAQPTDKVAIFLKKKNLM